MAQAGLIGVHDLATVQRQPPSAIRMPLSFGKIGAAIALLTIAAFVLWLLVTTFFVTEQAEETIPPTGAISLDLGAAA
jgi:hypothetical protein